MIAQALLWLAAAMVVVAAGLTLWRLTIGPSTLDRIVSADVLLSVVLISVGIWLPYLLLSKRVNVTYRHRLPA